MAYNPYGGHPYGPPPNYGAFPGASQMPGMGHSGLAPPPGMSPAPGIGLPPGVHQPGSATQANRPSGMPPSFQPPPSLSNINFNAPVIRLGAVGGMSSLPARPNAPPMSAGGRRDPETPYSASSSGGGRPDFRHDRGGIDQSRMHARDMMHSQAPPSNDEKLRTVFVHKIPESVGGEQGVEKLLGAVGKLRRWDSGKSHLSDHKGDLFGFAQFEDTDSLASAIELLKDIRVPRKKQEPRDEAPRTKDGEGDGVTEAEEVDTFEGIDSVPLQFAVDPVSLKYIEAHQKTQSEEATAAATAARDTRKLALKAVIHDLFYPPRSEAREADGDVKMTDAGPSGEDVEVVNIPLAQEDELADIPAEVREMVASEIASFRERSNRRDMERLKREQELEEQERRRNGEEQARLSRHESPPPVPAVANSVPLGPRSAAAHAATTSRAAPRSVGFVNGGTQNGSHAHWDEEDDTDASDDEVLRRRQNKKAAEEEKAYQEAERKWVNRERQRAAALEREKDRDRAEEESADRYKEEQLDRYKSWDDEREAARKTHVYYRDHTAWLRKRAHDRAEEERRDAADRRTEQAELRKREAEMETARDMADSFLEQQAQELDIQPERHAQAPRATSDTATAPQRVTISFGAAAQRAQAQRAVRTVAEVEGLLDDEEQESTAKRQLVPIKFEPMSASAGMSDEEINQAVRALAQEIPTEREGLWAWDVQWDHMDGAVVRDKLRPFVEKKVVEYLGVQDQFLVEVVEEHLQKHSKPEELVEELQEALDDAAEDLVKKLWRMVIFFTESEKRGLPA